MPNVSFRLNGVFSLSVCVFCACFLLTSLPAAVHAADPAYTMNAPAENAPATPPLVRDALQVSPQKALAVAQPALPASEENTAAATNSTPFVSLPFSWFEDQKGTLGLADVIKLDPQTAFQTFGPGSLPRRPGTIWLRVELPQNFPPNPVLNMNTRLSGQIPGKPQIWLVSREGKETIVRATGVGLYPLPLPAPEETTLYIQIPGLPGVGFAPLLMSQDSVSQLEDIGDPALLALLTIVLFLCLLRGLAERKEWRFWAAIYTASILVYAFWGLPATPNGVLSRWDLPGLFAPGVALLMLPHIGRQLMHTRSTAPVLDMLFILLALPGIALSALPLLPDYAWGLRYLPLWPLYCILLLLPAFIACLRRIPGSGRYILLCLFPPLGMLALYPLPAGLEERLTPGLISLFPQAALTLSCLLAALFRTPRHKTVENSKTERTPHSRTVAALRLDDDPLSLQTELPVATPLALSSEPSHRTDAPETLHSLTSPIRNELPAPHTVEEASYLPSSLRAPLTSGQVERVLRAPLDTLLREVCILDQANIPLEYRSHVDALSRASRSIIGLVADLSQPPLPEYSGKNPTETFDINQLLLEVHDSIEEQAEQKNLGLTWFTAPHLPRYYEGRRQRLFDVLKLLAESAVLSTDKGMIQIRAQRVQDSTDPGHLQFTISDTGQGIPPYTRSSLAFTRAWELAAANGEQVSLNSSGEGTTISFTVHCTPRSAEVPVISSEMGAEELSHLPASSLRIIVVGGTSANRQLLSYYLDELPHEILEARSPEEAEELYRRSPGALIIFNDDMPEERIAEAVAAIRLFEGEHMFPLASILALVCSEEEGDRMRRAGCTHIMIKPVVRRNLRHLALRLAPLPRKASRPLLPEKRVPADPPKPEPALLPEAPILSPTEPAPKQSLMARLFGSKPQKTTPAPDVEKNAPAAVQKPVPLPKPTNVGDPMPRKRAPGEESEPRPVPERLRPRTIVRCVPAVPHAPSSATEWVGEPTPINTQPVELIEWVGEAQPLSPQPLTLSPSGTSPLALSTSKETSTVSSSVSVSSAHSDFLRDTRKQDFPSGELSLAPKSSANKDSASVQGLSLPQPGPSHAPASLSMDVVSQSSGNRTLPEADRVDTGLHIETIIDLEAPVMAPAEHSVHELPDTFSTQEKVSAPKEVPLPETEDLEIEHVLNSLDEALSAVLDAQAREDRAGLTASAARLGQIAKEYDLRLLEDPASCLGLAVAEGNFADITQLIPDLIAAVSKNRAAFSTPVGDKADQ